MEILTFKQVFDDLNITQAEAAEILGDSQMNISRKISRGDEIKISEMQKFQKHFKTNLFKKYFPQYPDAVEVKYYECDKLGDLIKHPEITSVWRDREITHLKWKKDEKKLVSIKMLGDSMDGGERAIRHGDMLTVDTTQTSLLASGVYVYTTGEKDIFVAYIKQYMDKIIFTFNNPEAEEQTRTKDELRELNFRVIGRVIHNESELW